jgi:hypothetical protein
MLFCREGQHKTDRMKGGACMTLTFGTRARFWRRAAIGLVLAGLAAGAAGPASAIINPDHTPVHLTRGARLILQLEAGPLGESDKLPLKLVNTLKGEPPASVLAVDLSRLDTAERRAARALAGQTGTIPALLFIGGAPPPEDPDADFAGEDAWLLLRHQWFALTESADGVWEAVEEQGEARGRMQAVWYGSAGMLARAIRYIQADPHAHLPVEVEAVWDADGISKLATIEGAVHDAMAVDLAGDGKLALHILADNGDRVFQWDADSGTLTDLTGRLKLGAKSRAATWGDFTGEGRLDLASWDGAALRLWAQTADGTFVERDAGVTLESGCIGLTALDAGVTGRAGILVSTTAAPLLLTPVEGGRFAARAVGTSEDGTFAGAALGGAWPCVVADFDGDRVADILQPLADGALFYKGIKPGVFAPPQLLANLRAGAGGGRAFTGDYDHDGLLDLFVAGAAGCQLWHNLGGGRFESVLRESGEVDYITRPHAMGGATCDVNTDGRQDVLVLYSNSGPHMFFNRGFRSFGYAEQLLTGEAMPAEVLHGQQAGVIADFNGNGAQDLAVVSRQGGVWVLLQDAQKYRRLGAQVSLPAEATYRGPLTVSGWSEDRALGAWNVLPGIGAALFGVEAPGPVRLKWQLPGGAPQETTVIVEAPTRFVIPARPGPSNP